MRTQIFRSDSCVGISISIVVIYWELLMDDWHKMEDNSIAIRLLAFKSPQISSRLRPDCLKGTRQRFCHRHISNYYLNRWFRSLLTSFEFAADVFCNYQTKSLIFGGWMQLKYRKACHISRYVLDNIYWCESSLFITNKCLTRPNKEIAANKMWLR